MLGIVFWWFAKMVMLSSQTFTCCCCCWPPGAFAISLLWTDSRFDKPFIPLQSRNRSATHVRPPVTQPARSPSFNYRFTTPRRNVRSEITTPESAHVAELCAHMPRTNPGRAFANDPETTTHRALSEQVNYCSLSNEKLTNIFIFEEVYYGKTLQV